MTINNKMRALITYEQASGYKRQIEKIDIPKLNAGDILIKTQYSSLNYKDALSASGHKGITRKYPHIAGIDVAGAVEESGNHLIGKKVMKSFAQVLILA